MTPTAFALLLAAAVLTPDERAVLDLTNRERTAAGLEKLRPHPVLTRMARSHSATMARLNQLGHDLDGKTFQDRATASVERTNLRRRPVLTSPTRSSLRLLPCRSKDSRLSLRISASLRLCGDPSSCRCRSKDFAVLRASSVSPCLRGENRCVMQ